jgi:DNA polymerase-3 subunit delta
MPSVTPAQLKQQIAKDAIQPLYLLFGADETEKAALVAAFVETLDEGLRPFNLDRLHGAEIRADDLIEASRRLPLMAERRIVVVNHADPLIAPKREESEAAEQAVAALEALFSDPPGHAVIVLVADNPDSRKRLVKLLLKEAVGVVCGVVEDLAEARRWIKTQAEEAGIRLEPAAINLLAERGGTDVARLRAELERAQLFAGGTVVTADAVRQTVGEASLQDEWGFANALRRGDVAAALRELALLFEEGRFPPMILGQIAHVVRTDPPAAHAREAVDAVFRTDHGLKQSGSDPRILLERLVVELCAMAPQRTDAGRWGGRRR